MRSKRVIISWMLSFLILMVIGCGGNSDDSAVVVTYFKALQDKDVDGVRELTDPYQRSPRVDYHLKELVDMFIIEKPDEWSYRVVAKSDSTVKYVVTTPRGDIEVELVSRDGDWYVASIPGGARHQSWDRLKYDRKRPLSKDYPRYSEIFGTGSSIDSSWQNQESVVTRQARKEMEEHQKKILEESGRAKGQ